MKKTFYSNGKLLITGEYLVLDGAISLALPTKFGQTLTIAKGSSNQITWKSYDADNSVWFQDTILFQEIKDNTCFEGDSIKTTLVNILNEAYKLNPTFLANESGFEITTELSFPKNWGLGTSSTLINNIAQWLDINAFTLLNNSFGGSGYDIACAQHNTPILYQLLKDGTPKIQEAIFQPIFTKNCYFVYLNKKQSSKTAIASYNRNKTNNLTSIIAENDVLTETILNATRIDVFTEALEKHEKQMSIVLELSTVKETTFPDFKGTIKSLGAWGGDFILVVSEDDPTTYFMSKGHQTIIPYSEMILK